jgi:DNA (cytosine-5)-methyltransferase 1
LYACSARHTGTDWSRTYVSYPQGRVRRLTPLESERIQGFPDNWTLPPQCDDDPDKIDSQRYHAAGNAVTVNVAEWIGHRVKAVLEERAAVKLAKARPAKAVEVAHVAKATRTKKLVGKPSKVHSNVLV